MAFVFMCFLATDINKEHPLSAYEYAQNRLLISSGQSRPGKLNGMFGKKRTIEEKQKIKATRAEKTKNGDHIASYRAIGLMTYQRNLKCKGWTNGELEKFCEVCPNGGHKGRNNKHKLDGTGKNNPTAKVCLVFDKNMQLINEYDSGADAEHAIGLALKTIKNHINKKEPYLVLYYFKGKE